MSRVIGYRIETTPSFPDALGVPGQPPADPNESRDSYLDKLVKYVPAEVTAVAAGLFAAWDIHGKALWVALAVLALVNIGYLAVNARQTKTQPKWYFYLLATVAFAAWSVSTVASVAEAFNLDTETQRAFVLAAAAFLIPLVHNGFEAFGKTK